MSQFIPSLAVLASSKIANNLDEVIETSLEPKNIGVVESFNDIEAKIIGISQFIPELSLAYVQAQRPDLSPQKIKELVEQTNSKKFVNFDPKSSKHKLWREPTFCSPYIREFFSIEYIKGADKDGFGRELKSSSTIADIIVRTSKYYRNLVCLWSGGYDSSRYVSAPFQTAFFQHYTLDALAQISRALSSLKIENIKEIMKKGNCDFDNSESLEEIYQKLEKYLKCANVEDIRKILIRAAENGHTEVVEMILKAAEAKILTISEDGAGIALRRAAENGHTEAVEIILKAKILTISEDDAEAALRGAAGYGYSEIVEMILKAKILTISEDGAGKALMWAAEDGHTEAVEMILKAKILTISEDRIRLALRRAAEKGHTEVVEIFKASNFS